MWINPDFVKVYKFITPDGEEKSLFRLIEDALSHPSNIMEINWGALQHVTGVSEEVWDRVYETEDWDYDDETLEAMYALKNLIRPLPPQVPLESYL